MATQTCIDTPAPSTKAQKMSILYGPTDVPLVDHTLGELLELQSHQYGNKEALVIPWTGARWTYNDLNRHSYLLAQALLDMSIGVGDRVGIMAGNCEQYAAVFFAVCRIGAILVILNNTYTATEAMYGLNFTACKVFFTTRKIGRLDNSPLLAELEKKPKSPPIIMLRDGEKDKYPTYDQLIEQSKQKSHARLIKAQSKVLCHQVANLQFTSGTTGHPKAATLTHHNLVNNARFIGDRMRLTPDDILCCPPPLFHCFGLVLGLLSCITHGSKIVYPAEIFNPAATLRAITDEKCTAIHGVPAMFDTLFSLPRPEGFKAHLRTGIIAGAPVPKYLMEKLVDIFGMTQFTSSYGLTEASPTCFNAFTDDALQKRLTTVGTLMPHAMAKIVDHEGNLLPIGQRGELCIAGYQLQAGYWDNSEKTAECMVRDASGTLWLHTGDEAVFDSAGYCSITGRFKDIIIRGGENIYPLEIEERLMEHELITRAIVVGIKDAHYGEVVGAFLEAKNGDPNTKVLSLEEVREWVQARLGKHKAPTHIFWLGRDGVPNDVPLTGSGKVRKFEMAKLGNDLIKKATVSPKL